MVRPTVIEFAQRMETDTELRRQVEAVNASQKDAALAAIVGLAINAGFDLTAAELEYGLAHFGARELSSADLDAVVGGSSAPPQAPSSSSAFVSTLVRVIPNAIPHGGFIDPCW